MHRQTVLGKYVLSLEPEIEIAIVARHDPSIVESDALFDVVISGLVDVQVTCRCRI